MIGSAATTIPVLAGLPIAEAAAAERSFRNRVLATLTGVGYPASADPARINKPMLVGLLTLLMLSGAMTLGPISAALVEMFPTRIRHTAMSLPASGHLLCYRDPDRGHLCRSLVPGHHRGGFLYRGAPDRPGDPSSRHTCGGLKLHKYANLASPTHCLT